MWLGGRTLEIVSAKHSFGPASGQARHAHFAWHDPRWNGYYLGGKALRASAVSLTASWMRPALPGELFAIAGVLKQGRKVAFLAAELRGREGLVLATVNATAVPVVAS